MKSDNKENIQSNSGLTSTSDWSLEEMMEKYKIPAEKVRNAVEKVGNSKDRIEKFLKGTLDF